MMKTVKMAKQTYTNDAEAVGGRDHVASELPGDTAYEELGRVRRVTRSRRGRGSRGSEVGEAERRHAVGTQHAEAREQSAVVAAACSAECGRRAA